MRLYFSELAKELNIEGVSYPPPGVVPEEPQGSQLIHPNVWGKEGGERVLAYLNAHYPPGSYFEYDGHGDCWMMLAIMDQLRDRELATYIGGPFGRTLKLEAYCTDITPIANQPCTFTVEEQGENVLLTVHLTPDGTPFDLPFRDIVAPEIPAGKNIYVRLDGRHLLFAFPVALTYGESCKSIIMDYAGECVCAVSHRPDISVGDKTESPFLKN